MKLLLKNKLLFIYIIFVSTLFIYFLSLYIHYYKAIIGYSDTAFQFFYILQNGKFAIFHLRYIAVLSQVFAYIGSHLPLDINIVMKAHTANMVLLYVLCFSLLAFVFKKKYLALLILMLPSFMQHFSFYYPIHELMYGYCFFMLPITYIYFNIEKIDIKFTVLIAILSSAFFIFIHPFFSIISVMFFSIFLLLKKEEYKKWIVFILIGIFVFFIKVKLLSGYEKNHVGGFNFGNLKWKSIVESYMTFFLKETLNQRLYILKYLIIICGIFLLIKRQYIYLLSTIGIFISTYLITYVYLPNGGSLAYMEAYLLPTFASVLFLFFIYLEDNYSKYSIQFSIILIPFCIFGLFRNKSEKLYINRAKFIEKTCNSKPGDCFLITSKKETDEILLHAWALPYESLILTTASGKSKTMFMKQSDADTISLKNDYNNFGADWEKLKLTELNPKYFHIKPQAYHLIE